MTPDCLRVLEAMEGPLPPDLAAHRDTCPDCQALLEGFTALGAPAPPSVAPAAPSVPAALEPTRSRALEALAAQPVARPWWYDLGRLLAVSGGLSVLVTGAFWATGQLRNASPPAVVAGTALLVVLAMGVSAWVALVPARRLGSATLVGVGVLTAGVAWAVVGGGSGAVVRGFLEGCLGCARTSLLLSVLPALVALDVLRRLSFQAMRALAAGLSAGAVGLLLLHVHCPEGGAAHLAVSHVGPWLAVSGLVLAARGWLSTRVHAP